MARFSDRLTPLLACLSVMALCTACTNDGDIGDLYGKWQYSETSYINFQGKICQMQIADDVRHEISSIWAGYEYTADSLFITVSLADYVEGTAGVEGLDPSGLLKKYFDMTMRYDDGQKTYDNKLRFGYKLTSERLILTNNSRTWSLRHYGF